MSGMDLIIILGTFLGVSFGMMYFIFGHIDKQLDKQSAEFKERMNEQSAELKERMNEQFNVLSARMDKLSSDIGALRQEMSGMNMRIGRIEGSLNPFHSDYFQQATSPSRKTISSASAPKKSPKRK